MSSSLPWVIVEVTRMTLSSKKVNLFKAHTDKSLRSPLENPDGIPDLKLLVKKHL